MHIQTNILIQTHCYGVVDLSQQPAMCLRRTCLLSSFFYLALPSHADTTVALQRGLLLMLTINMHFILLPSIPPLCLLSAVIAFKANQLKLFATALVVKIQCLSAEVSWRSYVLAQWLSFSVSSFRSLLVQICYQHNPCQPSYIYLQMWCRGGFC